MDEGVTWRVLSLIGVGGFGTVYRARMESPDGFTKEVALKVLSDDDPPRSLLQRFRDEARILGLIRDRAIVSVQPPIRLQPGGRWAVVMEFVDGVSLGALSAQRRIPPGVAVEIVGEVARALHNAYHQEGPDGPLQLLHRDIKPDNIQLTPAGEVRLLDFGIARANFAAREFKTRASFGGTPGYIAPERPQGVELAVGDVYSLGVVLHEIVTQARPRWSPTVDLESTLAAPDLEVSPDEDPGALEVLRLAARMRAEEAEDRPSAREVEEACRALRQKLPPPYLRDWAEQHVPHRHELEPDDHVGRVFTATSGTPVPSSRAAAVPPSPSMPPTPIVASHVGAAAVGGVAVATVLSAALGLLLLGGVAGYLVLSSPTPAPAPAPVPVPAAPVPEPEPEPAPVPVIEVPAPSRPKPPSPAPAPVVITLPPEPPPAPVPAAPTPAPAVGRTGRVEVRTIPSGATVSEKGLPLQRAGSAYVLSVGSHVLEVRSTTGETAKIPVIVKADDTVEICYSFDTNSSCGAGR